MYIVVSNQGERDNGVASFATQGEASTGAQRVGDMAKRSGYIACFSKIVYLRSYTQGRLVGCKMVRVRQEDRDVPFLRGRTLAGLSPGLLLCTQGKGGREVRSTRRKEKR